MADRAQYLGQLVGAEPGEAAGGGEQFQPLVARVGPLPVEAPLLRVVEPPRLPDPVGDLRVPGSVRLQGAPRRLVAERRVGGDPAEGCRERLGHLGWRLEYVTEDRQAPLRTQDPGRLEGADRRVHPVPRLGGDHGVEGAARRFPGLEGRHLDGQAAGPREVGHPRVRLDAEHGATGGLELPGRDACPAADVEYVGFRPIPDDARHQGVGVARSGPVVAVRVRAEGLGGPSGLVRRCRLPLPRWGRRGRRR